MKIGICTTIDQIEVMEKMGFDYIEPKLVDIAHMTDNEYQEALVRVNNSDIKCEAFNVLFPGDIRLVGANVDRNGIKTYLMGAFERISGLGARVVVFGSGGARKVPKNYALEEGWGDLVNIARMVGETASQYDIAIAMEPLNRGETNIINSVGEGIRFANEVNHPNIRLLADFYHMRLENEPMNILSETTSDILIHTHIANGQGRYYPLDANEDIYIDFFNQLKAISYEGRLSIEGETEDVKKDGPIALNLLRELAK